MSPITIEAPAEVSLGIGKKRAVVISGTGTYFSGWATGYLRTLLRAAIELDSADLVIGSSSGALPAAALAGGRLQRLSREINVLGHAPMRRASMNQDSPPTPSQMRARKRLGAISTPDPASIMSLGRAAAAAHNQPPSEFLKSVRMLEGMDAWPNGALYIVAIDCYTGERVVVSVDTGIPIFAACAASMSLPGHNGPIWLNDRLCMDGNLGSSSAHLDLAAGAERVIVLAAENRRDETREASGLPNTVELEATELASTGSKTMLITAMLDPELDPFDHSLTAQGMQDGSLQAEEEFTDVVNFWE